MILCQHTVMGATCCHELDREDLRKESFHPLAELALLLVSLAVYCVGLIFQKMLHDTPGSWAEYVVFLAVYIAVGWRVLLTALLNLFHGKLFDENFLMAIATVGAIAIHQLPEATAVLLFFRIGEYLQDLSIRRSRRSIHSLLALRPDYAHVVMAERIERIAPEAVEVGQVIVVRPGERIPLDGVVLEGVSQVDTSALTGESVPRRVFPKSVVMGGMINQGGLLHIRVTHPFAESSVAKILQLVESADAKKAPTEKLITRLARYYTPLVVLAAFGVAVLPPLLGSSVPFERWIYRALTLLVISCPCGLVISIPLGYFGGIGGAAKRGILIKGSIFLDSLIATQAVAFDKTGTLTQGTFTVTEVVPEPAFHKAELIEFAAKAELHASHPLSQAIRAAYKQAVALTDVKHFEEIPAYGVRAHVLGKEVCVGSDRLMHREGIAHHTCRVAGTIAHVAIDGLYAGYLVIADKVKHDALEAIEQLRSMGISDVMMLTGDNPYAAKQVADELGIDHYRAELLPEEKVEAIEQLMQQAQPKGKVAFVGDGINDAPVLTRADIGIAMGGLGSDAAIETADVVIMADSPRKVAEAITLAGHTRSIVIQNIVFALAVKVIVVILAGFGLAGMWEAVFADVGVALIAIFNSTRTLRKAHALSLTES